MTTYSSMPAAQLIRSCAQSNHGAAWDEFFRRFHRSISVSILRITHQFGFSASHVADDLVQETYLKLCANNCQHLSKFAEEHPEAILGYIKTVAANVAYDHVKAMNSRKRGAGQTAQPIGDFEPSGSKNASGAKHQ